MDSKREVAEDFWTIFPWESWLESTGYLDLQRFWIMKKANELFEDRSSTSFHGAF